MEKAITLDEILDLTKQLSLMDKVRLIERIAPQIEREVEQVTHRKPRTPILGMWEGVNISDEDIQEARQEMWGNFPREDI